MALGLPLGLGLVDGDTDGDGDADRLEEAPVRAGSPVDGGVLGLLDPLGCGVVHPAAPVSRRVAPTSTVAGSPLDRCLMIHSQLATISHAETGVLSDRKHSSRAPRRRQNAGMQVSLLGSLEVRDGGRLIPVAGARLSALLARLAVDAGQVVSAGALIDAVWGASPPADAPNALQSLVSRLRRTVNDPASIAAEHGGYRLAISRDDVDITEFERAASEGKAALRRGDPESATLRLRAAVAYWRGSEPDVAPGIGAGEATRLTELRLDAITDRCDADLQLGRHREVVAELEALAQQYPLRERFTILVMTALARSGRTAEAIDAFERVRRALVDELGMDPSPELRAQHLALVRGDLAALVTQQSGPVLGGVGDEADVAPPPADIPPSDDLLAGRDSRAPLTSFIGRDKEVAALRSTVAQSRLVTVLGPGGAGKTRLAREVITSLEGQELDGSWWVELAPISNPAEVPHAVLASLGRRDAATVEAIQRRAPREVIGQIADHIGPRRAVMVFDNCEHLLDAAAALVVALLDLCPALTILTTSREPLTITGETLYPLDPLAIPPSDADVDSALDSSAVQLFLERAVAVRSSFRLDERTVVSVVQIVRRLDGLPLALELAAARLRTLPVADIAARLDDRFRLLTTGERTALPHHRTLAAVVGWSWDLLADDERLLAEQVSIFPAGVTPVSAAEVCAGLDSGLDPDAVPDLLGNLVDRSLLQLVTDAEESVLGAPRYRMLETIREFGAERLAERDELAATRARHARHFAALAAAVSPLLQGPDQMNALDQLTAEHDNMLAALRFFLERADEPAAVELASDLSWYWWSAGRDGEATTWLPPVLALPPAGAVDDSRRLILEAMQLFSTLAAHHLGGDGAHDPRAALTVLADRLFATDSAAFPLAHLLGALILFFSDDHARSHTALSLLADHPEGWVRARALSYRARFAENSGNVDAVRADSEASLAEFAAIGDEWGRASVLPLAVGLRLYDSDLDGAMAAAAEAQAIRERFAFGEVDEQIFLMMRMADIHMRRDEVTEGIAVVNDAVALAGRFGRPEVMSIAYCMAATFALDCGDMRTALARQSVAQRQLERYRGSLIGADHGAALVTTSGALIALQSGDVAGCGTRLSEAIGPARRTLDMPIVAYVAIAVAEFACAVADFNSAATALGAADQLRGAPDPTDRRIRRITAICTENLGQERTATLISEARALAPAAAIDQVDAACASAIRAIHGR